jgi:hypothetical protein
MLRFTSMLALSFDPSVGKFSVLWDISMIPKYGAVSPPSTPTVAKCSLQLATGNTYSIPAVIIDCQTATQNVTAVVEGLVPDPCLPRDIWRESVLAIDIELGIVNWVNQLPALDAWTLACGLPPFFPETQSHVRKLQSQMLTSVWRQCSFRVHHLHPMVEIL